MPVQRIALYNLKWLPTIDPISRERDMIRHGGRWKKADGTYAGEGLLFHFIKFQQLLWPEKKWHKWNRHQAECYLNYRTIGVIGPASSGKTNSAATDVLADYYCFPEKSTVLCCSTTRERLEDRVWGEIKKYHLMAKKRCPWLAGHLIEGRQRIVSDVRNELIEGRDFRNGLIGVPCKRGSEYVGLGDFIGIKNKRVRVIADELSLLPGVFVSAISNLDKNPDLKVLGLGNPKETTDALGVLCEPAAFLGGWEGGIDQQPGTKTWLIKRPQGICLQLPGSDSPNLDGKLGIDLITQEQIDRDVAFYGRDSLWFTMMNEGRMPRGQGSRRVITRQMCINFHAMDQPNWMNSQRTKIAFLDAAYRGVGGDRCVFGILEFGNEAVPLEPDKVLSAIITQNPNNQKLRQIIALNETMIVPINPAFTEMPEDQIVAFAKNQCISRGIPPENFFFDSGMRTSLVTAFSRLWSAGVNSVDCGGTPSETTVSSEIKTRCRDYYSKFITELWFSVRLVIEAGQFRGMTDDMILEGSAREWTLVSGNKIEVEPKHKMKEKTGRSPDLFDGLAVGIYGARRRGFIITRQAPPDQRTNPRNDWRQQLRNRAATLHAASTLNYRA